MAYGRYEGRRGGRDPRSRTDDDRFSSRGFDRDEDYGDRGSERGFFERAGDEVASWFGDDDAERRRRQDQSREDDGYSPGRMSAPRDYDRYEREARFRDEGYRRPYTGRMPGRWSGGPGQGERHGSDLFESDRNPTQRDYGGMAAGGAAGLHDPHYSEWRRRQIDALDRDYHDYRRENEGRFESEFTSWRQSRQSKRDLLGSVREHMNVLGSDSGHVGTVDKVRGDRIILTKSDSSDQHHHMVPCSMVDRVEGDNVVLDQPADTALRQIEGDSRRGAMFDREDERSEGPHILNRSFSGTY